MKKRRHESKKRKLEKSAKVEANCKKQRTAKYSMVNGESDDAADSESFEWGDSQNHDQNSSSIQQQQTEVLSSLPPIIVLEILQYISIPLRCYTRYMHIDSGCSNTKMEVSDTQLIKLLFGYFQADSQRTIRRLYSNIDTRGCHIYKHRFHRIVCESNFWNILNSNFSSVKSIINPFKTVNAVSIAFVNVPATHTTISKSEMEEIANRGLKRSFTDCSQMQRFSLDDRNTVTFDGLSWLSNCKRLTYLKLCRTKVSLEGIIALAKLPNLKTLLLNGLKLPPSQLSQKGTPLPSANRPRILSEIFSKHPTIQELELTMCYLDEIDLCELLKNEKLCSLSVRQNRITNIPHRPQEQNANTKLESLDLSCNAIGCSGVKALLSWVSTNLCNLSLCSCRIEEEGGTLLLSNKHVRKLDISKNSIPCEAFQALANNCTIEDLDISGSYVCAHVAAAISKNTSLTSLNLVSCHMNDRIGAILFKDSHRFKSLLVADNLFTSATLSHIVKNAELNTLDFSSVKSVGIESCEMLAAHPSLKTLKLYKNNIQSEGAYSLFQSKSITSLNLSKNKIGDDAVLPLVNNRVLRELILWSNQISDQGVNTIFKHNKTLVTVNLLTNQLTGNADVVLRNQSQLLLGGSTFA